MSGEIIVLRLVRAEGSESPRTVRGAIDDQIGGIVAIQHSGQGMSVLPRMDGKDIMLSFRREEDGPMREQMRRVPILAATAVGEENRGPVFF